MFFSKYIKIIFVILLLIFINISFLSAQEETSKVQTKTTEATKGNVISEDEDYYDIDDGYYNEDEDLDEEISPNEHGHLHEHEHEHEHNKSDLTGENAEFGRETSHNHEHEHFDDCEYFHKAWREPGTIDIMKKYSIIIFSLFGFIAIYRIIMKKKEKHQKLESGN